MPDVNMDFDLVEETAGAFTVGASQVADMVNSMKNIARALADGVLWGEAGDVMLESMDRLIPKCEALSEKFEEISRDLRGAVTALRDEDHDSANRFK